MKAFRLQDGFGLERVTEVDLPVPTPGPGQALIRMKAVSPEFPR